MGRTANTIELDDVNPRRLMWRLRTAVLVLRARRGEWFIVGWFESDLALVCWWRIVDPSGLERVTLGERTRVASRRAPAWVSRVFDRVRVVGERDGAPDLALVCWWRIVDPSGLERVTLGERTRVASRRAPAWVSRVFDRVRVVGERDGAPVLELEDSDTARGA